LHKAHTEVKIGISLREIPETPFLFAAWKSEKFCRLCTLTLGLSVQDGDKALEEHLVRMVELTSAGAGSTAYIGNYTLSIHFLFNVSFVFASFQNTH
jgi:hypothetical protein